MVLQSTGSISVANVAVEFGDVAPHSMSEFYAKDVGVPTAGTIGLANFYGKANKFLATLSSNVQEFNLRPWLVSLGWNQFSRVELTIASGVYVWSDNTSVAALDMGGSYPNGLTIINNGFIMGRGGNGAEVNAIYNAGTGITSQAVNGDAGGNAINLTGPITINNINGYIGGGGGGGGLGYSSSFFITAGGGPGGGAGGGLGGKTFVVVAESTNPVYSLNGAGGAIGQVGTNSIVNPSGLATTYVIYPMHGGAGGYTGTAGQDKLNAI